MLRLRVLAATLGMVAPAAAADLPLWAAQSLATGTDPVAVAAQAGTARAGSPCSTRRAMPRAATRKN